MAKRKPRISDPSASSGTIEDIVNQAQVVLDNKNNNLVEEVDEDESHYWRKYLGSDMDEGIEEAIHDMWLRAVEARERKAIHDVIRDIVEEEDEG